jgi:hypothetical protein
MSIKQIQLDLLPKEFKLLSELLEFHFAEDRPKGYHPKEEYLSLINKVRVIAKRVDVYEHLNKE